MKDNNKTRVPSPFISAVLLKPAVAVAMVLPLCLGFAVQETYAKKQVPGKTKSSQRVNKKAKAETSTNGSDAKIFFEPEQPAHFPGGVPALMRWLAEHLSYPEDAQKKNIQGRVIVKFVIGKDGTVEAPEIIRSVDSSLDAEALRIVKMMPRWVPGKLNGKVVRSYYTLPVTFRLDSSESTSEDDNDTQLVEIVRVVDIPGMDEGMNNAPVKEMIYTAVETMPEFPGGMNGLMNWLSANLTYPENAIKNGIEGRVIVRFVVNTDGSIEQVQVAKGVDEDLDAEAVRVVKEMPRWQPGKNNGLPVRSYFNLPITFKFTPETEDASSAKQ